jgi:hypothetical protein
MSDLHQEANASPRQDPVGKVNRLGPPSLAVLRNALALNAVCWAVVLCWNLGPNYLSLASIAYLVFGAVLSRLVWAAYGRAMQVACLYFHIVVLFHSDPADQDFAGAMAWHGLGMAALVAFDIVRAVIRDVFISRSSPLSNHKSEIDS